MPNKIMWFIWNRSNLTKDIRQGKFCAAPAPITRVKRRISTAAATPTPNKMACLLQIRPQFQEPGPTQAAQG